MNEIEAFLLEIITCFADKLGKHAVLRGGMVLRLLDSARLTNDLDYTLIPFKSKNEVVKEVLNALNSLEQVRVTHNLNSKCLRCYVQRGNLTAQVEVKVDKDCKVEVLSTVNLAKLYNRTSRIINVMSLDLALAHKLSAWYERRLLRDIYDIYLFLNMGIKPNLEVLETRLKKPDFAKNVAINIKSHKKSQTIDEFFDYFKVEIKKIKQSDLDLELSGILGIEDLLGLEYKIKTTILSSSFSTE
jgi:predicted nucleotidyltransferase component of viral defense system